MPVNFSYHATTGQSVKEAAEKVKQILQVKGFGTLWELNIPEKLKEKGVMYNRGAIILEVCNPQRAKEALEANKEAIYFLPCKIAVYEGDNQTVIGMIRPSMMMDLLNDETLKDFAAEVERVLIETIDEATL
jgi:uncharacterized protein (DUF302 family)